MVSNALDRYGIFYDLRKIELFGELQDSFVIKIHSKNLVPQNEPPMLDKMSTLQNIFRRNLVNVDEIFIFKWGDLSLNIFSPTKMK